MLLRITDRSNFIIDMIKLRAWSVICYERISETWLVEGRSRGGQTRKEQLGHEGYQEMGHRGGETRREQMGQEGYQEMGKKGGLSTMDKSAAERVEEEGIEIDESKFRTKDR